MSMHVTRLSVTPVKGLALHHPASVDVDASGVIGDRLFYLVDDADVLVSISRTGGLVGLLADYDAETSVLTIREDGDVLAQGPVEL